MAIRLKKYSVFGVRCSVSRRRKADGVGRSSGFSLIEMSVVLTVIAFVAGGALVFSNSVAESNKERVTRERIEYIFEIMEKYVAVNQFLPCPADPSLDTTNTNFGVGQGSNVEPNAFPNSPLNFQGGFTCSTTQVGERSHTPGGAATKAFIVGGMVPVTTLGLSPKYALDGWGRRFTYVVDHNLTWRGPGGNAAGDDDEGGFSDRCRYGDIEIRKTRNPNTAAMILTPRAAVAIISHGNNGHGAWSPKGGSRVNKNIIGGGGVFSDELENSYRFGGGGTGLSFNNAFVVPDKPQAGEIDDIVGFRVKEWFRPLYNYPVNGC